MAKKDLFGDDTDTKNMNDFGSLFEQSTKGATRRLSVGDQLKGELLLIGREQAFVSTGTPQDGAILLKDLLDENGVIKYKVGDILDVIVVRIGKDEILLTRKGATHSSGDVDSLEDAFDMEIPVEGKVLEAVNGGYRIQIMGTKAFCPFSQIDKRAGAPENYIGKKFDFLISQFEKQGRNIVVSRRKLLDAEQAGNEGSWLEKNKVGEMVMGTITRLEPFGAFVELGGGVEGLVHISELGWSRVKHPSEVVHVGDKVQVKILKIDEEDARLKISLSIKQAGGLGDPWIHVPTQFPVGMMVDGKVENRENFGLFVNIAPGITGLLPRSAWRDSGDNGSFENKKRGDSVRVQIAEILYEQRRMSFRLPTEQEDETWKQHTTSSHSLGALAQALQNAQKKTEIKTQKK